MKTFFSKALTNKILLNIVFILSLLSIIGYIILGDITSVAMFMMLALITVNFSKNMIIVLGLPMVIVSIFYAFINKRNSMMSSFREGMETKNEETENAEKENAEKENTETDVVTSGNGTMSMTAVNAEEKITNKKNNNASTDESFEVGRNKKGQYNIDYASTIEDAYDELNKILGSDGIKNLTDDTQKLMKQQMMLAESMQSMEPIIKGMGPLLEKAEGLLGNMGGDSPGNLDSLKKLAQTFTGKKG
jgi:hypothetical protein